MRFTQLTGVGISLIGVLAIVTQLHPENLFDLSFNSGDLIIITNMVLWAIYCACLRLRTRAPAEFRFAPSIVALHRQRAFALWSIVGPSPVAGPKPPLASAMRRSSPRSRLHHLEPRHRPDRSAAAGAFLHTIPLFSTTLAMVFLGEQLKLSTWWASS